jgi:uncharacterized protein YbjT (DUF2867 family)
MRCVVVSTATGRVGRWVARSLRQRNVEVELFGELDHSWRALSLPRWDRRRELEQPRITAAFVAPPHAGTPSRSTASDELGLRLSAMKALRRVVLLSSIAAHREDVGIIGRASACEASFAWLDVPTTFVRAAFFMENWRLPIAIARRTGYLPAIFGPIVRPMPMVAIRDVGAAVEALLVGRHFERDVIEIEGPARATPRDLAEALTSTFGRSVRPVVVPVTALERWVDLRHRDPSHAREWKDTFRALREGRIEFEEPAAALQGSTWFADFLASEEG